MYFCENLPGGYRCACPSDMVLAPDKISCIPCKLLLLFIYKLCNTLMLFYAKHCFIRDVTI